MDQVKSKNELLRTVPLLAWLLLQCSGASATPVTFWWSGKVSWDYVDVPVGTVIYGSVTYDSDATLVALSPSEQGYIVDRVTVTLGGETASNYGGSVRIKGTKMFLNAGPFNAFGGGNNFSSEPSGIFIAGMGLSIEGLTLPDVLPSKPEELYGLGGDFYINRSGGSIYDINTRNALKMPSSAGAPSAAVPEPSVNWLLLAGLPLLASFGRSGFLWPRT